MTSELDKFLEERSKFEIPKSEDGWVRLLAQEIALGVHRNLWNRHFDDIQSGSKARFLRERWLPKYEHRRWKGLQDILSGHGYFEPFNIRDGGKIKEEAFRLLQELHPYNIFISYRRLDSSALALLVLARLKEHELVPFVDMALEAGGNWHADLEERIKDCDYFIILLGKETLSSPMTVKEIQWAIQYEKTKIPLWHSGFDLKDEEWLDIPTPVRDAVRQTSAIIVQDESAGGYNTAIVELLNRFGVTP